MLQTVIRQQSVLILGFIQFKILHNRLVTQTLLMNMSKSEAESCIYCKKDKQVHALLCCP